MQNSLVYFLDGKTYINLTNACSNSCIFCVRDIKDDVKGSNLWLEKDCVKVDDVVEQLVNKARNSIAINREVTFCGYGEPLLRFDVLKDVCKFVKKTFPGTKIRVNTNGHASFLLKKNIPSELKGLVNCFSISLNAENEELYNKICKPNFKGAYDATLQFAKQSVAAGIETVMSVVVGFDPEIKIDVEKCSEISKNVGAKIKIREWIKEGY